MKGTKKLAVAVTAMSIAALCGRAGAAGAQARKEARQATATADLATTVTDHQPEAIPGMTTVFTVTVTNNGPSTAQDVTVADNWSSPSTFYGVQATAPGVTCTTPPVGQIFAPHVVTCAASSLGSGRSVVIGLVLFVRSLGRMLLQDTATATSATPDPSPANNTASDTLPMP